jgi:DNA-binding LacI/PurR family transcriptional regulator
MDPTPGSGGGRPTRPPSIYDVAEAAGVAASTVSRALSRPDRVSFRTAEHIRKVAAELGYRMELRQRSLPSARTHLLAMIVADITNPVFFGLIRGAERTATHAGYTLVLAETQESEQAERQVVERLAARVDGVILASSRLSDGAIRAVAKTSPLVVLNRFVDQVPSVTSDNVRAVKRAVEHLVVLGHRAVTYLSGPEASWADSMRWRGLLEAGHELEIKVRRIGPYLPTINGGRQAAERWRKAPTSGVVAYNDLVAIGFMQAVAEAGLQVPRDVSVVGFDNIRDAGLVRPQLTTIASPLVSLGSAAVNHLLKTGVAPVRRDQAVILPARVVLRESTGPAPLGPAVRARYHLDGDNSRQHLAG